MSVHKHFKKYFIPHEENNYKPHLLREASVLFITVLLLTVFVSSGVFVSVLSKTNFLAAIFTNVLVDLANQDRAGENLPALVTNDLLVRAAQMKANDMAAKSYFAHNSPDGKTPWYWIDQAGYNFTYAGENLAVNFADSGDVNNAWMNSPGHRANIMNQNFTEIGIATAQGVYQGQPTIFVVQMFGRRAIIPKANVASAAPVNVTPAPSLASTTPTPVLGTETTSQKPKPTPLPVEPKKEPVETREKPNTVVVADVGNPEEWDEAGEIFLAFQREGESGPLPTEDAQALGAESYASWFDKAISNPKEILTTIYLTLAAIILAALIFMLLIEVRRQHPAHFLYGLLLIAFIIVLLYLNRNVLFPEVIVA